MDKRFNEDRDHQEELKQALRKLRSEGERIRAELAMKTMEFEEYRRNSVPLSVHKPVVEKLLLSHQRNKSLQMEVDEAKIQQNVRQYHRKIVEKVSSDQPEVIIEAAAKIETKKASQMDVNPGSSIYGTITKEDVVSTSSGPLSRAQKRREQRKRKAQLHEQAKVELQKIHDGGHSDTTNSKDEVRSTPTMSFLSNENVLVRLLPPVNNREKTVYRQKWLNLESKYEDQKEKRHRLQFKSITTGQGEEYVNLTDSDD